MDPERTTTIGDSLPVTTMRPGGDRIDGAGVLQLPSYEHFPYQLSQHFLSTFLRKVLLKNNKNLPFQIMRALETTMAKLRIW